MSRFNGSETNNINDNPDATSICLSSLANENGQRVREGVGNTVGDPLESGIENSGTNLLDLNDDCLYEILILKYVSVVDLCAVARTSIRLRDIANIIFCKRFEKFKLKSSVSTIQDAKKVITTFGSLISELWISSHLGAERRTGIFNLVTKCCSNSLLSLHLYNYDVPEYVAVKSKSIFSKLQKLYVSYCTIEGACHDLFGNCESLLELVITGHDEDMKLIFGNEFPNLNRFRYSKRMDYRLENFISQQKNLKSLNVNSYDDCSFILPIIAGNCEQLKELQVGSEEGDSNRYEIALSSILTLKHLKKLQIDCQSRNVTRFTQELSTLKSLRNLEFWGVGSDSEFLPALSQLKQLQILRLTSNSFGRLKDIKLLYKLDKLTELSIQIAGMLWVEDDIDLDVVCLVKHLTKLISLELFIRTFFLENEQYKQIVKLVQNRTIGPPVILEIKCYTSENLQLDNGSSIKIIKLRH